jgi:hypothetical protein
MGPAHRLSHETFLKYLGLISKTASRIDRFLLKEIIGNFELLYYYHLWKSQPRAQQEVRYPADRALQRTFHREDPFPSVSTEFCAGLIKYYDIQ